jgi:hypothetical protein
VNIGDKVRAIRDFYVEPLFDGGWEVKKDMSGIVYANDLEDGEIAVDFGESLDSSKRKGVVVLIVPLNAIEPVSKRCDAGG